MLSEDQNQCTGNNSFAIQAGNIDGDVIINKGLSYGDAKEIFNDLFERNFYRLSGIAKGVAEKRAQEIIDKFLCELESKNPDGLNQAIDPDFQYDVFIAQREYARCGDLKLAYVLISLLIERTKETERSLLQIVLNESLIIASKLTKEEFDILTIIFVLQHHSEHHKFHNIPEFANYIVNYILPFWSSARKEDSLFAHLRYTGCGSHLFFGVTGLEDFLKSKYDGLPLEGFSNLRTSIESVDPRINLFFDVFESSIVNHTLLTSVGIAIGYANLCRATGEEFNLSRWI